MNTKIRLMVVEDHHVVREGLVALLSSVKEIEVVASVSDGDKAVTSFSSLHPDVTLMDLQLPGMGGAEATRKIREQAPDARVIVLTTYDGDEDIFRALQAGACGYLLKGMPFDELVQAIYAVHRGESRIPSQIADKLAERSKSEQLTPREIHVLERIVAGRANKDIASDLSISEATVKTHVNNLLAKLGVVDRTQAATAALQRGFARLR
ncbi:response regulator transcription factor [Terriglobus sp. TAA 43]|uniref:response regulator n=1 Tax=Terriglobus sp. TAA 43 TaxID=278961 RepID=UPI00064644B3|nr:response regulator transcription factor [Terriglobus sp. TAA 43]